jgi:hypothetical protein
MTSLLKCRSFQGSLHIYLRRIKSSPVQEEEMELEYPKMRAEYKGNLKGREGI